MIGGTLNTWAKKVHTAMLASGERLTSGEIEARFGRPSGTTGVGLRMANAVKGGWFTAEPAAPGSRFHKYAAVRWQAGSTKHERMEREAPVNLDIIGRGFHRVPSVFELARFL